MKNYVAGVARWLNPYNDATAPPTGRKINILSRGRNQIIGHWDWFSGHLAWSPLIGIEADDVEWIKENEQRPIPVKEKK